MNRPHTLWQEVRWQISLFFWALGLVIRDDWRRFTHTLRDRARKKTRVELQTELKRLWGIALHESFFCRGCGVSQIVGREIHRFGCELGIHCSEKLIRQCIRRRRKHAQALHR